MRFHDFLKKADTIDTGTLVSAEPRIKFQKPSISSTTPNNSFATAHSCTYCEKIVIDPRENSRYRDGVRSRMRGIYFQDTEHDIDEVYEAYANGCLFYEHIFGHMKGNDIAPLTKPAEDYLERFTATWGQGRLHLRVNTANNDFDSVERIRPLWRQSRTWGNNNLSSRPALDTFLGPDWCICAVEDTEAAEWVKSRPINQDVGSPSSLRAARLCLEECHANHEDCKHDQSVIPSRLVEILANGQIKLITTEGRAFDYCALSYCWGGDQSYKTTMDNITEYHEVIRIPRTAKTIHDAVIVTKSLGLRYIWIDALTIIQDSEEDKIQELSRMPGIYKGAFVTLVGSSAASSSEGFLQERKLQHSVFKLPFRCPNGIMSSVYLYEMLAKDDSNDPVQKRAWCLQESILSPRIIKFSRERVHWNCRTPLQAMSEHGWYQYGLSNQDHALIDKLNSVKSLTIPSNATTDSTKEYILSRVKISCPPEDFDNAMQEWMRIISRYSRRQLTVPSDKLVALAGVAAEFAHSIAASPDGFPSHYAAGLWYCDLERQLLWKRTSQTLPTRPQAYYAPTWSWASINSPVQILSSYEPVLQIIRHEVHLKNPELLYGEVTAALLSVKGRVKQAFLAKAGTRILDRNLLGYESLFIASATLDANEDYGINTSKLPVWLLEVGLHEQCTSIGIVIVPAELSDEADFKDSLPSDSKPANVELLDASSSPYWDMNRDTHSQHKDLSNEKPRSRHLFRRIGIFEMREDYRDQLLKTRSSLVGSEAYANWFNDASGKLMFLV